MKKAEKFVVLLVTAYVLRVSMVSLAPAIGQYLLSAGAVLDDLMRVAEVCGVTLPILPRAICAAWLYSEAKARGERAWLWAAFGWVSEILAVLVFFAMILCRSSSEESRTNQRPDGTAAKAPSSNPSQGAAVPHP